MKTCVPYNIDANIKGRNENGERDRNLSCLCIEVLEEIAAQNDNRLTVDGILNHPVNGVFSSPYVPGNVTIDRSDLNRILDAEPEMKTVFAGEDGVPRIRSID